MNSADAKFVGSRLDDALRDMRAKKPNDRSEVDRRCAIAITELEKLVAYWYFYAVFAVEPAVVREDKEA